jgi:hypothetical protein
MDLAHAAHARMQGAAACGKGPLCGASVFLRIAVRVDPRAASIASASFRPHSRSASAWATAAEGEIKSSPAMRTSALRFSPWHDAPPDDARAPRPGIFRVLLAQLFLQNEDVSRHGSMAHCPLSWRTAWPPSLPGTRNLPTCLHAVPPPCQTPTGTLQRCVLPLCPLSRVSSVLTTDSPTAPPPRQFPYSVHRDSPRCHRLVRRVHTYMLSISNTFVSPMQ